MGASKFAWPWGKPAWVRGSSALQGVGSACQTITDCAEWSMRGDHDLMRCRWQNQPFIFSN